MPASCYLRCSDCFYNVGQFFLPQLICFKRFVYSLCWGNWLFWCHDAQAFPSFPTAAWSFSDQRPQDSIEILLKFCRVTLGDFFAFSPYWGCIHCSVLSAVKKMVFTVDISLDLHTISHQTPIYLHVAFQTRQSSHSSVAFTSYNSVLVWFIFYPAQHFLERLRILLWFNFSNSCP